MSLHTYVRPTILSLAASLAACGGANMADPTAPPADEAREVLAQLTDFDPLGFDACSDAELIELATFATCLEGLRDARCDGADVATEDCSDNVLTVPDPDGRCAMPDAPDARCVDAIAPGEPAPPANGSSPLLCAFEQEMVNVAQGAYFDAPARDEWSDVTTYRAGGGFAFTGRDGNTCFVGIRGYDGADDDPNVLDGLTDFLNTFSRVDCGDLEGQCVESFLEEYQDLADIGLYDAANDMVNDGSCGTVALVGHSLGGTVADILGAHLYRNNPLAKHKMRIHTFGSPRVFDSALARAYDRITKTRWMADGDPFPGLFDDTLEHFGTARLIEWVFEPWNWRIGYIYDAVETDSSGGDAPWAWAHLLDEYDTLLDSCN